MNYKHLTIEERACIYQFRELGMSIRNIAKAIERSPSTISRELKRNDCGFKYKYLANVAEKKYKIRRKNCHRKTTIRNQKYIENKIELSWSPEQIVNYEKNKPKNMPVYLQYIDG